MRRLLRFLPGPLFVFTGVLHFLRPRMYEAIMPDYLPAHRELVLASGVAELLGGLALMAPRRAVRRWGGWWMVATLVAVLPANLHMALHPERYPRVPGGAMALYARLPLQALLIAWTVASARR